MLYFRKKGSIAAIVFYNSILIEIPRYSKSPVKLKAAKSSSQTKLTKQENDINSRY